METRAGYVLVGLFVVALFVASIGGAILLGDIQLDQKTRPFRIDFSGSVAGLSEGSGVRYRGVPVGSVSQIKIDPSNVEQIDVIIEVDTNVPIKADMVAVLESQGLTGIGYIEIQGGSQAAADLVSSDGAIPVLPSRPSSLQQVFKTAPEIASQLVVLMARAEQFLKPENEKAFADILASLGTLSAALADKAPDIETAIDATTAAARQLETSVKTLAPVFESLDRELVSVSEETKATLAAIRGAATGLEGEIGSLSKSLQDTSKRIGRVAGTANTTLEDIRPGLEDFSQSGLYEVSQFLVEARVLVGNLDQLVRQINRDPSQFLFGSQEGQVDTR
jgi:phospholipid/cholesterol/gamma-HCH transport system substrate-binding protein